MIKPEWQLQKFIIGIRHQRTFMISDIHGVIADIVLSLSKKSSFPKGGFAKVARQDVSTLILTDNTDSISVNCNIDGIIVQADMSEGSPFTIEKVEQMFSHIVHEIIPLTKAVDRINRIGVVYEFHIPQFTNSAKAILSQFIKVDLHGIPDNTLMRMSLKNPTAESLSYPDKKNDYKNVILTLSSEREKSGEDETEESEEEEKKEGIPTILKISADCQIYYIPQRDLKNVNIPSHLSDAKSYVESTIKKIPLNVE